MKLTDAQKELAAQYFEAYPNENVLLITKDGNVFLQSGKADASNHQRSISPGTPITTVFRKQIDVDAPENDDEEAERLEAERIAAEEEAQRIADEEEAARLRAERIAAEEESTRVAAEEESKLASEKKVAPPPAKATTAKEEKKKK